MKTDYSTNFSINTTAFCVVAPDPHTTDLNQLVFTKIGTFICEDGYLANHHKYFLKVVKTDALGNPLVSDLSDISQLTPLCLSDFTDKFPQATTYMNLHAELPTNIQPGSNNIISDTQYVNECSQANLVYDANGNEYNVVIIYTKIHPNTANGAGAADFGSRWVLTARVSTNTIPPIPVFVNSEWINGVDVVFRDGMPSKINEGNPMPPLVITPPTKGALPLSIKVNPGTLYKKDGLKEVFKGGFYGMKYIESDGYTTGKFESFSWSNPGEGVIHYNNGHSEIVCKVPLVTFESMYNMKKERNGVFSAPQEAGKMSFSFANPGEFLGAVIEVPYTEKDKMCEICHNYYTPKA